MTATSECRSVLEQLHRIENGRRRAELCDAMLKAFGYTLFAFGWCFVTVLFLLVASD